MPQNELDGLEKQLADIHARKLAAAEAAAAAGDAASILGQAVVVEALPSPLVQPVAPTVEANDPKGLGTAEVSKCHCCNALHAMESPQRVLSIKPLGC